MTALDPVVYELKNNLVSSFSFVSMAIVGYYVIAECVQAYRVLREEKVRRPLSVWRSVLWNYKRVRMQLALSFAAFMAGEYVTSGWSFAIRFIENRGNRVPDWMSDEPFIYLPIFGGTLQVISAVCLIRILTPNEWGHRGWIAAALYSVLWSTFWILWR